MQHLSKPVLMGREQSLAMTPTPSTLPAWRVPLRHTRERTSCFQIPAFPGISLSSRLGKNQKSNRQIVGLDPVGSAHPGNDP